ncbi:acid-sensing ion channel 1-like protein [Aphelenchoides avenae]|nr:acid-sensing ion channel 1-like protein [Aphelenchus avenae]
MVLITLAVGLITLWRNYLPWTQAVVVAPLIAHAKRPWVKDAWTTVLVATTAVFVVQSGYLVKAYFEYRTNTNIRLIYEPEATFPAVTFCNLNPLKKSTMEHSQELTNLVATYVYVTKVKQEQMKRGTTATARTTTPGTESHERKKRQAAETTGTTPV